MKWFFEYPGNVAVLRQEAESWIGTPFRPHSKAKGISGGVDCVGLCEGILCPVIGEDSFSFPRTPMDYSMHNDSSVLLDYLRGKVASDAESDRLRAIFAEIPNGETVMPGDLVAFKIGKCAHHLAVALSHRHIIHCFTGRSVDVANLQDSTFAKRIEAIFRTRVRAGQAVTP
jgi:cell wall-associated NlpC family hydrolase